MFLYSIFFLENCSTTSRTLSTSLGVNKFKLARNCNWLHCFRWVSTLRFCENQKEYIALIINRFYPYWFWYCINFWNFHLHRWKTKRQYNKPEGLVQDFLSPSTHLCSSLCPFVCLSHPKPRSNYLLTYITNNWICNKHN